MTTRRAVLALLCVLALAAAATPTAEAKRKTVTVSSTPFTPRVPPDSLGINAQFVGNLNLWTITPEQRRRQIAAIAAQGIKVVRLGPWWGDIQPDMPIPGVVPRQLNWAPFDVFVSELASEGIRVAPTMAYNARWAGTTLQTHEPPRDDKDWADFARDFTARYGRGGAFWSTHPSLPYLPMLTYEIWNEPNWQAYWNYPQCPLHVPSLDPSPRRYAELYDAVQTAIKGVDSAATVFVGGLVAIIDNAELPKRPDFCTPQAWLAGMRLARPNMQIDGIGIHIYWYDGDGTMTGLRGLREVRQKIDELGWTTNIPLYLNETGWRTQDSGIEGWDVPDADRGAFLADNADEALRSNCLVRQYMPHTWLTSEDLDDATDGGTDVEDYFGIADPHATATTPLADIPYESGRKYGEIVRILQGEGPTAPNPATEPLCEWRP